MLTSFQRQAYASGAFTKSTLWNFTDLLLLYYFADIQGLGAAAAGLILMVSLLVSGVLDISLSLLLDRYNLHYQKVIASGAPLTVLSFAILFYPLPAGADYLFTFYLVVTILFRIGYALVDIPHNAMMGSLTRDSHERTRLSSSRIFYNSCAILLFAAFAGDTLAMLESQDNGMRTILLITASVFMLVNIYLCILPVWREGNLTAVKHPPPLSKAFRALLRNKAFMVLALYSLLPCIFIPVFYKSGVYFASMLFHDEKLTTWLIMSLAAGKLVALPWFNHLSQRMEKHHAMILALAGLAVTFLSFLLLIPATMTGACVYFVVCGFFSGGLLVLVWSALPDTIEYGARDQGIPNQALTFGAFHLVMRISDGLSFAVIAGALEYAAQSANADIESVLFVEIISLVASAGCLLGAVVLWFYPLTRAVHNALATEKDK